MIIFALTFVTQHIGVVENAMIALMSGPMIDRLVAKKR
jgi:hypothetical protein